MHVEIITNAFTFKTEFLGQYFLFFIMIFYVFCVRTWKFVVEKPKFWSTLRLDRENNIRGDHSESSGSE